MPAMRRSCFISARDITPRPAVIDPADLTARVEERPASEYLMIPLQAVAQVPDFSFVDFTGSKRGTHDLKARFTLLYFWASWCPPCREESRALTAIYGEFDRADFDVIGLSSDETLERLPVVMGP